MLTDAELEEYFDENNLIPEAREYIRHTRNSPPARLAGANAGNNICTSFVSTKMGFSDLNESRHGENAFAIEYEFSNEVLEFWCQPLTEMIYKIQKNGVKRLVPYTPDFLVLGQKGPRVVQIKLEDKLDSLVKKYPDEWKHIDGEHIHLPANNRFEEIGLIHKVSSTSELNKIRTENLRILIYARREESRITRNIEKKILSIVEEYAWIKLSELMLLIEVTDVTPVIQLIEKGSLFFDVNNELLTYDDSVWICASRELVGMHKNYKFDNSISRLTSDCEDVDIERVPTKEQADRALNALKRVKSGEKSRSVRRYKQKIKEGGRRGLTEFQSLIDNLHLRGNRKDRLSPVVRNFLQEFISSNYSSVSKLSTKNVYSLYKIKAKKYHPKYHYVSVNTFKLAVSREDNKKMAKEKGGRRLENAASSPSEVKNREIRATLPFEIASIDHYLADIFLVVAETDKKVYSARPWITVMVDMCTKYIMAVWVSFRSPSSRACGMVFRQCARRFGRLPAEVLVDHGAEFLSTYFLSMLADQRVGYILRPSENPRYGSEAERTFKDIITKWLSQRPGYIENIKDRRSISRTHAPEVNCVLTVKDFINELSLYKDYKNKNLIGNKSLTSELLFNDGREKFPFIGSSVNADSDEFILSTAVDVRNYTFDPARGINIDGRHFWHPALKNLSQKKPEVRHEPEDPYRVYARVGTRWVTCSAKGEMEFQARDPVARAVEAVLIWDGRSIRDKVKEESDEVFVELLDEGTIHNRENIKYTSECQESEYSLENNAKSVYDDLRDKDIEPLKVSKWKKSK